MADRYEIELENGRKVICRSAKSAAKLIRELGRIGVEPEWEPWPLHDFQEFTGKLKHAPTLLLARLLTHESATDEELRIATGATSNQALAGVLSGVSKVAASIGLDAERVYTQTTRYERGKPVRSYKISPAFRDAAKRNGWPSEDDLKPPFIEEDD